MEEKLFHLVEKGTSAVMVVQEAARQLKEAGFEELSFSTGWGLTENGRYYVRHHDTALFAFTIGARAEFRKAVRIGAAHTDFPCLRIKPNPDISAGGYGQVNVEVYGGAILNTWLDRPLSISGRVALQSEDVLHPEIRYLSVERPLLVIPNLAIHMNREINKGLELNKQTDMLPILGLIDENLKEQKMLMDFLGKELQVEPEKILDYELWAYCAEKPRYTGIQEEFILSPRLDNLTSVQSLLTGLIRGKREIGLNVAAFFDHEEVGSRTKQGAGSLMLLTLLEKINASLGKTEEQMRQRLYDAFFLSVDVAHGLHPNQMGKMDLTNKPVLGRGLCIKEAGSQSYATDCEAVAVIEQICRKYKIPYQKFVNRSDLAGGGTLGSIASSILSVRTVDLGVPVLAMHSAVETMGAADMKALTRLMTAYYSDLDESMK
ncbi:M18 family aminopeptidase [Petralouisia muris]|uniref:M18 family aminopeptidase n=1 Tax=Petralouisia muris TaxID=3032872 RepID=A0AC61RZ50_9FIRM|nr:M18 family aminopeptidase [Petralouisia muris]TGY97350.1 M18 family aminopeptidase [Petralouisia muris]